MPSDLFAQDRLEQRLVELETRLTFQEQAMVELSEAWPTPAPRAGAIPSC